MRNVAGLRRFPCPGLTNSDSLCDVRIISPAMFCDVAYLRVNRFERKLRFEFIAEVENVGHAAVESRLGNSPRVAALRWSVSDHLVCGGYLTS